MSKLCKIVLLLSVFLSANFPVFAIDYGGTVEISEKGKAATNNEYEDAVVYFVPNNPESVAPPVAESKEIIMRKKTFLPRVVSVTVGSKVSFPNFDPILHNAFSTSTNNSFDLGLYDEGENEAAVFNTSGLVRVYCNVHHAMVAYILVFDNSFYTSLDSSGNFKLEGLPETNGTLYIWHPRANILKQEVDLASATSGQTFKIDLTKRRIPKHKNKKGNSYREARKRNL